MLQDQPAVDLTVIIVNWNTRVLLRRALDSLVDHASPPHVEVIVVDNGSRDGSQAMLRPDYPWVQIVENTVNTGFARANNQGARLASSPLLFLLNSDAAVRPGALNAVITFMRTHPDVGIVGCQLLNEDLTLQAPGERFPALFSTIISLSPLPQKWRAQYEQRRSSRDYSRTISVDTVYGAAMVVGRNLFETLHGFDERFYFTSEETDLC